MTQEHTPTSDSVEISDATRQRAQQRRVFAEAIGHIHDQHDGQPAVPAAEPIVPAQTNSIPDDTAVKSRNGSF